jgi:hypothetical protein
MSTSYSEEKQSRDGPDGGSIDETVAAVEHGAVVNASGYKDQLKRQYGIVGLAGIALTIDNAWVALGSSISVSISEFTLERIITTHEPTHHVAPDHTPNQPLMGSMT